jgi:hypothetical protein
MLGALAPWGRGSEGSEECGNAVCYLALALGRAWVAFQESRTDDGDIMFTGQKTRMHCTRSRRNTARFLHN